MIIKFKEVITPTEEEVIKMCSDAGLSEPEDVWCDIREIPVIITYDTDTCTITVVKEK